MMKRPICAGAVFLTIVIWLGSLYGESGRVPRHLSEASGRTLQVWGQVASREETAGGIRLYIENFSFDPKDNLKANQSTSENKIQENNTLEEKTGTQAGRTGPGALEKNEAAGGAGKAGAVERKWKLLAYLSAETSFSGEPEPGDWIELQGECTLPEQAANPGQFDARAYYFARKTALVMKKAHILQLRQGAGSVTAWLAGLRNRLTDSMEAVFGVQDAAVISAITLGDRSRLPEEVKKLYQEGGIAHILAVSSLHITLVCMGIYRIARKTGSYWLSGILSGIFAVLFCLLTGRSASAVRAVVMFLVWLGSQAAGRTCDRPTSIALAALVILTDSPLYLQDSSFLLSFGCVLTLVLLLPAAEKIFPVKTRLGKALLASCTLQIGTLPVTMRFFYQVTPYAPLMNLAVVPCMSCVMASGLAGGLAGLVSPAAGTVLAAPCHYLLKLFELLCRLERRLPGAVIITGCPESWKIAAYYGLLAGICLVLYLWECKDGKQKQRKRRKAVCRYGVTAVLLAAVLLLGARRIPELRITFLDVGQGDGILLETRSFTCLIDGGSSSEDKVWQYRIESALKYYGIGRLDAVFVSHGDLDHTSGIQEMLEGYEENFRGNNAGGITLDRLILADSGYADERLEALRAEAEKHSIAAVRLKSGGRIRAGEMELRCLSPSPEWSTGDPNQDSMVLLLRYRDFSALFTGDLEGRGEQEFVRRYRNSLSQVTLLKVGHHGSGNATGEEFLSVLSPRAAVISCGKNNRYGHPAEELLQRLNKRKTKILRTDQDGAVAVWLQNGRIRLQKFDSETDRSGNL